MCDVYYSCVHAEIVALGGMTRLWLCWVLLGCGVFIVWLLFVLCCLCMVCISRWSMIAPRCTMRMRLVRCCRDIIMVQCCAIAASDYASASGALGSPVAASCVCVEMLVRRMLLLLFLLLFHHMLCYVFCFVYALCWV